MPPRNTAATRRGGDKTTATSTPSTTRSSKNEQTITSPRTASLSSPSLSARKVPRPEYTAELEFDSDESKEEEEEKKMMMEDEEEQEGDEDEEAEDEESDDEDEDEKSPLAASASPSSSPSSSDPFDFDALIAKASSSLASKLVTSSSTASAAAASRVMNNSASKKRGAKSEVRLQSTSDLNDIFTHSTQPASSSSSSSRSKSKSHLLALETAAIPAGFEKRNGVLFLTSESEEKAAAQTSHEVSSSSTPASTAAPDLLASGITSHNPMSSKRAQKSSNATTAGSQWFNFSRPSVITPEMKRDLQMLSLRAYMDPKKFYKKESKKKKLIPTFFQMGTVIAGAQDFYSSRLKNGQRTQHYADEYIDPHKNGQSGVRKMKHYLKKKVIEIQEANKPTPKTFNKKRKSMEDMTKKKKPYQQHGGSKHASKKRKTKI